VSATLQETTTAAGARQGSAASPSAKSANGRIPKVKCCVSKPKCGRCPLRMLAEGTLPAGYSVKKRRLIDAEGKRVKKQKKSRAAKKKDKRSRLPEAA
jgi:hypothetical protein